MINEREMQLVAYVAAELEEAGLQIASVEDTGGKIVFHLGQVSDDKMTDAVPYFEAIENECRYQKEGFAVSLDIEVRLVTTDKETKTEEQA